MVSGSPIAVIVHSVNPIHKPARWVSVLSSVDLSSQPGNQARCSDTCHFAGDLYRPRYSLSWWLGPPTHCSHIRPIFGLPPTDFPKSMFQCRDTNLDLQPICTVWFGVPNPHWLMGGETTPLRFGVSRRIKDRRQLGVNKI